MMKMRRVDLFFAVLFFTLLIMPITSVFAESQTGSSKYVVTCNHHYLNKYNTLGRFKTMEEAKKAISKDSHKGQWYIYNSASGRIEWPELKTGKQKMKKIISWLKAVSKDPRHGYTCEGELSSTGCDLKWNRWGRCGDYSCSTLVGTAYELFGFSSFRMICRKHKYTIPTYSGRQVGYSSMNIIDAIKKSGKFKDISNLVRSNRGLKAGDILVTAAKRHVAIMVSDTTLVEAWQNEKHEEYSVSVPGDQLGGGEILMRNYYSGFYYAFRPIL